MERGEPMPESTECGCSAPEPGPVFPESLLAPLATITGPDAPATGGVGKLDSSEVETVDSGLVELSRSPTSDLSGFSCIKRFDFPSFKDFNK